MGIFNDLLPAISPVASILNMGRESRPTQTPQPNRPDILGSNSYVKAPFQLEGQNSQYQKMGANALNSLNTIATAQGPSQQAQYLQKINQNQYQNQLANQSKTNESQFANLKNDLSMRGGLTSDARERIGTNLANSNISSQQNLYAQNSNNNLKILQGDEANKQNLLKDVSRTGLAYDQNELNKKRFDITNSLNTANNYYNQDMSKWAALNASKDQQWAARNTGGLLGNGGFLGTGIGR